jgi:DNA repair protein RecO (recombination protein O)
VKLYKADAIVLRSRDCGEGNRILVLYSREYGKLRAMAHGVAKPSSKKRGAVQLFSRTSFLLHRGRELDSVSQCEVLEMFPALRGDLGSISQASYIAELVDAFTPEGEPNGSLFLLLLATFRLLAVKDPELLIRAFEVKIAGLMGYNPVLEYCAGCGGVVQGQLSFSPAMGGILCEACSPACPDGISCSRGQLEVLKILASWDPARLHQLKVDEATRKRLQQMLQSYLKYHLEGELKSAAFLSFV